MAERRHSSSGMTFGETIPSPTSLVSLEDDDGPFVDPIITSYSNNDARPVPIIQTLSGNDPHIGKLATTEQTTHAISHALNDSDLGKHLQINNEEEASEMPTSDEFQKAIVFLKNASSMSLYRYDFTPETLEALNVIILLSLAYFERPTTLNVRPWVPALVECVNLAFLGLDLWVRWKCFGVRFMKNKWNWLKAISILAAYIDLIIDLAKDGTTLRVTRIARMLYVIDFSSHTHQLFRNLVRTWIKQLAALIVVLIWIGMWALYGTILFSRESPYFETWSDAYINLFASMTTVNFPDIMVPSYATSPMYTLVFFIIYMSTTYLLYLPISIAIVTKNFKEMMVEERLLKSKMKRKSELACFEILDRKRDGVIPHNVFYSFLVAIPAAKTDNLDITKAMRDASCEILKRDPDNLSLNFAEFRRLCDTVILPLVDVNTMEVVRSAVLGPLQKADLKLPEVPLITRFINLRKLVSNTYLEYTDTALILLNGVLVCWTINNDPSVQPKLWTMILDLLFLIWFSTLCFTRTFVLGVWNYKWNIFDLLIIVLSIIGEILRFGSWSMSQSYSHASLLLSYARFLRLLSSTSRARAMASVLWKLIVMLGNFAALLIVLFYTFALLGVFLFQGDLEPDNPKLRGTDYANLDYFGMITYNNFPSAMTTNFHLMVVNNWHVTAYAIMACHGKVGFLFFLLFWFTVPITMINIIIAFVIDSLQFLYNALSEIKTDDLLGNIMQQTTKSFETLLDGIFEGDAEGEEVIEEEVTKEKVVSLQ